MTFKEWCFILNQENMSLLTIFSTMFVVHISSDALSWTKKIYLCPLSSLARLWYILGVYSCCNLLLYLFLPNSSQMFFKKFFSYTFHNMFVSLMFHTKIFTAWKVYCLKLSLAFKSRIRFSSLFLLPSFL